MSEQLNRCISKGEAGIQAEDQDMELQRVSFRPLRLD